MSDAVLNISFADDLSDDVMLGGVTTTYAPDELQKTLNATLSEMSARLDKGLSLPYFVFDEVLGKQDWQALPKSLDVYVCGTDEGQALNLDARGKDYATNILSYPSGLPNALLMDMGEITLGELVICHDVVVREADEQGKSFEHHLTHLLVHGILHLLGFDHELGQAEQDEMEGFEIAILSTLGIDNPYL